MERGGRHGLDIAHREVTVPGSKNTESPDSSYNVIARRFGPDKNKLVRRSIRSSSNGNVGSFRQTGGRDKGHPPARITQIAA